MFTLDNDLTNEEIFARDSPQLLKSRLNYQSLDKATDISMSEMGLVNKDEEIIYKKGFNYKNISSNYQHIILMNDVKVVEESYDTLDRMGLLDDNHIYLDILAQTDQKHMLNRILRKGMLCDRCGVRLNVLIQNDLDTNICSKCDEIISEEIQEFVDYIF